MLSKRKITRIIGPETNSDILQSVIASIVEGGGTFIGKSAFQMVGQELNVFEYKIESSKVFIEVETYIGISIKGEKAQIDRILSIFNSKKRNGNR